MRRLFVSALLLAALGHGVPAAAFTLRLAPLPASAPAAAELPTPQLLRLVWDRHGLTLALWQPPAPPAPPVDLRPLLPQAVVEVPAPPPGPPRRLQGAELLLLRHAHPVAATNPAAAPSSRQERGAP
ncbi:MAG: hypothetical protein KatS3mg131_3405 [Candidatus Tectimicrobiota bacterium]|nr:MAG: hypothetical protein KatS3mg131_3405 [Candidatus Tectomicrobia bacterium]